MGEKQRHFQHCSFLLHFTIKDIVMMRPVPRQQVVLPTPTPPPLGLSGTRRSTSSSFAHSNPYQKTNEIRNYGQQNFEISPRQSHYHNPITPSHSRNSSGDTGTDFCTGDECVTSPTAWICDFGVKKGLSQFFSPSVRPFMSGNKNVRMGKGGGNDASSQNSDASVASWRARAAEKILAGGRSTAVERDPLSDEEVDERVGAGEGRRFIPNSHRRQLLSPKTNDSQSISSHGGLDQLNEPRILAPNVSKLAPSSVVEIRLQSLNECVSILCSVDVLKMRSVFFHEVLNEQEEHGRNITSPNEIWREPLVIPELSPFEAAAFLESLHESRSLFKGDWNLCWARLSVSWQVQEIIIEYSSQISTHFNRLLSFVHEHSWRTNPNILVGARVAVFRKGATAIPTIITGTVVEALPTTAYSKLRVVFDAGERGLGVSTTAYPSISSKHNIRPSSTPTSPVFNTPHQSPYKTINTAPMVGTVNASSPAAAMATATDICEPFWVQLIPTPSPPSTMPGHIHGSHQYLHTPTSGNTTNATTMTSTSPYLMEHTGGGNGINNNLARIDLSSTPTPTYGMGLTNWNDPDDLFLIESRKSISLRDKSQFWEMCQAIMELPKLAEHCQAPIRNSKDLANVMKRQEFRVLWTAEAPDILPKDAATELISTAYVSWAMEK